MISSLYTTGLDAVAAEHPHLVEGGAPTATSTSQRKEEMEDAKSDPSRLSAANLARLSLLPAEGKGPSSVVQRGGGGDKGSRRGRAATAASSAVSAAGSLINRGGRKKGCGAPAPSVSLMTAATGLSVAETVIARAQARKGMF